MPIATFLTNPANLGQVLNIGSSLFGSAAGYGGLMRSAAELERAGREAAEMAKFKPYSVKTGTATSMFDPESRTMSYTLDPRVKEMQDFLYGQTEAGRAGLAEYDPQAYAAEVLAEQQALQAPLREAEDIALRQQQLASGRIGLGVSPQAVGAGMLGGAVNPEQYRRDLARAQADAEAAVRARELGISEKQRRQKELADMFNGATGIEKFGTDVMDAAARYGDLAARAGGTAGQLFLKGMIPGVEARTDASTGLSELIRDIGGELGGMLSKQTTPTPQPAQSFNLYDDPYFSPRTASLWGTLTQG